MTVKAVISAMVLAVGVGVGAYGYYAPIMAMQGMQAAAEQRDADTFNQYVDYPQLRESLKGQLAGMMATQLGGRAMTWSGVLSGTGSAVSPPTPWRPEKPTRPKPWAWCLCATGCSTGSSPNCVCRPALFSDRRLVGAFRRQIP